MITHDRKTYERSAADGQPNQLTDFALGTRLTALSEYLATAIVPWC